MFIVIELAVPFCSNHIRRIPLLLFICWMDWQKIRIRLHLTKTKRAFCDEGDDCANGMAMVGSFDLFRHFPSTSVYIVHICHIVSSTSLSLSLYLCFRSLSIQQSFSRHIFPFPVQVTFLAFSIFMCFCVFLCKFDFEFDNLCDISSDFWAIYGEIETKMNFSTKVCVLFGIWCLCVDGLTLVSSYNIQTGNGRILNRPFSRKKGKWNGHFRANERKRIIHTQAELAVDRGRILPITVRIHIINFLLNGSFPSSIRCYCFYFLFLKGSRRHHAVTLYYYNQGMLFDCVSHWILGRLETFKRLTQACNSSWLCSSLVSRRQI